MNVILVDSDCKAFFPEIESVKQAIGDPQCEVYDLLDGQIPQLGSGCRCVLLTAMYSGIKKYHRDLIEKNPQVRCWTICIVNVSYKSEQVQLLETIDAMLADIKTQYQVVFEKSDELKKTAEICASPVRMQKLCLVVSRNAELAGQCCEVIAPWLKDWELEPVSEKPEKCYEFADVILAVGSKAEDFVLPAPRSAMGKTYVWVQQPERNLNGLKQDIYNKLLDQGWNIKSAANIYSSQLALEAYAWRVESHQVSAASLSNDADFVIWDVYGLPVPTKEYTDAVIREFLDRLCCFQSMTERF